MVHERLSRLWVCLHTLSSSLRQDCTPKEAACASQLSSLSLASSVIDVSLPLFTPAVLFCSETLTGLPSERPFRGCENYRQTPAFVHKGSCSLKPRSC